MSKNRIAVWVLLMTVLGLAMPLRAGDSADVNPGNDPGTVVPCPMPCLFAQDTGGPMGGRHHGPVDPEMMAQQRRHLEQLRMLKMLELLDLNDDQEVEFLTAFKNVRQQSRDLESQAGELLKQLSDGIESGTLGEGEIYSLVDRLTELQENRRRLEDGFLAKAREILTPVQLGKFVIFERRFEAEMLERLGRFREFRRQGQNVPGGPPDEG